MSHTYEYPRPMVCTDIIIIAPDKGKKKILLIKRKNDPFKGTWALPGGFVEMEEDLEDAAKRELAEETGITLSSLKQFATYGSPAVIPVGETSQLYIIIFPKTHSPLHMAMTLQNAGGMT